MKKNPILSIALWLLVILGVLSILFIGPFTLVKAWLASMGSDETAKKTAADGIAMLEKAAGAEPKK